MPYLRSERSEACVELAALLRAYGKLTERIDCMTREQKKQLRRGVLYIGLLVMICLLLIAGLTA